MSRAPLKIICGSNRLPHRIHFITSGNYPQGPPLTTHTRNKIRLTAISEVIASQGYLQDRVGAMTNI
jgi:hypothetical protein